MKKVAKKIDFPGQVVTEDCSHRLCDGAGPCGSAAVSAPAVPLAPWPNRPSDSAGPQPGLSMIGWGTGSKARRNSVSSTSGLGFECAYGDQWYSGWQHANIG